MVDVAIIFGGISTEHDISLKSADNVIAQLPCDRFRPVLIGITRDGMWLHYTGDVEDIVSGAWEGHDVAPVALLPGRGESARGGFIELAEEGARQLKVDVALPVLHGQGGEDGTVQGALEACGVQPGIKWTNDLVLGTKKLCGILTELTVEAETGTVDSIVAGIGVNVRQRPEDFPPELRAIAGSVRSETGLEISRARLAAEMVRALDQMYLDWQRDPRAYLDDYRARCVTVGRPVRVVRGEDVRTGFAEAVDDDFALVVRWPDGTRETVTGGDVSVRGLFGYLD